MSKTREEFLQKLWTCYPEMPRGALKWGRIYNHRFGLQNLSEWSLKEGIEYKVSEILIDGDLIAILPQNVVVLLAPNLTGVAKLAKWHEEKKWHDFLTAVREIFKEKKFTEVQTPTLVKCPGTEPSLEVFETEFNLDSKKQKFYLPTSPELNLKKLLVEGAEKIYEIAKVFRNGELTERHSPEFTMIEWYRSFSQLQAIKMDVIELVESLSDNLKVERPKEVLTFTIKDLFKNYCGFELTPQTSEAELKDLAKKLAIDVSAATCIDDYFYLIFMDRIENKWPQDRLVFVEKYPPYQAALARLDKDGWADRFEVYWKGFELGNAFYELTDPKLQRQRANEDLAKKKTLGKKDVELDEVFFSALDFGMPPSAGIAMGLERLFMALTDQKSIKFKQIIF